MYVRCVHVNSLLLSKFYKLKFQDENNFYIAFFLNFVLVVLLMLHVTLLCAQLITTSGLNFVVESLVKLMQSILFKNIAGGVLNFELMDAK